MRILIPRITDMHNGTFRPEILIDGRDTGLVFLAPVATVDLAWERACDTCEIEFGDWTDNGLWYVVP
ncbi:MAG: hypothetical protein WAK91_02310 [Candidatus Acidiferrales bacterium]